MLRAHSMLHFRHPRPAAHADATIEHLDFGRTDAAFRQLLAGWNELAAGAPIFASPGFIELQMALAPPGERVVAAVREHGRLVAVLPLVRHGATLVPLRSDHSQLFDGLGSPEAMHALVEGMAEIGGWDVLRLEELPEDSPFVTRLVAEARHAGCHVELRDGHRCPIFALPGFEDRLRGKHRANLRRCARKAGAVEYERVTTADGAALADGLRIEAMAWKGAAGTAITSDPRVEHAYHQLAHLAEARGELSLSFLRIDGARVAFVFGLEHGGTLHAMKIGYDPAFAEVSAGHLVAWKAAADAERRGLLRFDFMGQVDEWKLRWTDASRGHVTAVVYRPTLRGVAEHVLRDVVKPLAPEPLRQIAKRLAHLE